MPATDADLLALARSVAVEAGELALRRRREGVRVAATKSSPVDVVTETDHEVEELIRARLAAARPGDGFLGEESAASRSESGLTWVVDPIDGTVNFLYDIPSWAVSIAVVEGPPRAGEWAAIAGCVTGPALGEVYTAARGAGASLNGERIEASAASRLDVSLVGTGFGYDAGQRVRQAGVVAELIGRVRDVRRVGSAALDLAWVASARMDAYFERGLQPWDHAAGALIAQEAGAVVGWRDRPGTSGSPLLIAAAPGIVAGLDAALAELGA